MITLPRMAKVLRKVFVTDARELARSMRRTRLNLTPIGQYQAHLYHLFDCLSL